MKILMIAPEPIFEPRGTPLSVVGRLKALSDMGHQVDLVTYGYGRDVSLPGVRFFRTPRIPGVKRVKIGPSLVKIPLDGFLIWRTLIRLIRSRYHLIHTHEEAGFWGALFAKLWGIPHIYDMHSSLPQQLDNFQFTRSRILVGLFEALERRVLRTASAVITICPDLHDHVRKVVPERGSVLIENVVDYAMIFGAEDRTEEIRKDLGLAGKRVMLYTGTFETYQGLDLLIQSAPYVAEKEEKGIFLLVGGHPDQVRACQEQVRKLGMEKHFVFTGQVEPREVGNYIGCAHILLSPRTAGTNTPLKIYAYLRSGVPVVATRLWTHTQVLDDSVAVLTEPTPREFACGILDVIESPGRAGKLGEAARKLAGQRYSYDVYSKRFREVYSLAITRGS
jgi:glycosyltransferase involved in cell wall biosynthesis